jgi:ABC-type nitrate/sulfonate/bicarbonate transport system substrate-binding protein
VNAKLITTGDFPSAFTAYVGGQADGFLATPEQVIAADTAGGDFKFVGSLLNESLIGLVAKPGITSIAQLAGKTGVATSATDVRETLANSYLKSKGVDISKISWRSAGTPAGMLAAMQAGQADFSVFPAPQIFQARDLGYTTLVKPADFGQYPTLALTFSGSFIRAHPATVQAAMRAIGYAVKWLQQNKQLGEPLLQQFMGVTDQTLANRTYVWFVPHFENDCVPVAGLKKNQAATALNLAAAANLKLNSIVDFSFVRALQAKYPTIYKTTQCAGWPKVSK